MCYADKDEIQRISKNIADIIVEEKTDNTISSLMHVYDAILNTLSKELAVGLLEGLAIYAEARKEDFLK